MASRKSLMHPRLEELGALSPSSSPLRRRSSINRPIEPAEPLEATENDDETERARRRQEKNQPQVGEPERRRSMGLGFISKMTSPQIADKVSQCIKLSAENKINVKNAFSLEMIDFMTYMIKKRDSSMSNLQMASTSLDVSAKIYGFRVDGVHSDILKMIGGLEKQEKIHGRRESTAGDENVEADGEQEQQQKTKKKKKSKTKILATVESLRGTLDFINPHSMMMGESDAQTTDMLYQAILPMHANSDLYLNPYNDVILDTVDPTRRLDVHTTPVDCPRLERFDHLEMCQPFANFAFVGWSPEDELNLTPPAETIPDPAVEDAFHFDLDASPLVDDEPADNMNYFDMDDEDSENIARCQIAGPPPANIVDFRDVVTSASANRNFEYSYILDKVRIQNAGTSHWKIRYPAKNLGGSQIEVEGCARDPVKRRKEILMSYEDEEISTVCMTKLDIAKGKKVKLQHRTARITWSEEKLLLPLDANYDNSQCCKYFLRPDVLRPFPQKDRMNTTQLSEDMGEYDYNNEHDTMDYCPNVEPDEQQQADVEEADNNIHVEENVGVATQAFTGDNLVEAPRLTNKVFIPFSQRAKKIDMRALKRAIWKQLSTANTEKENIDVAEEQENISKVDGSKQFSDIYKKLPNMLTKTNAEALSVPIAFISLLHIVNEKSLAIESSEDLSDLFVRQD